MADLVDAQHACFDRAGYDTGNGDGAWVSGADIERCRRVALAEVYLVQEDDERWDCTVMGDGTCGPSNAQRVEAGRYVDGALVEPWSDSMYGA